MIWYEIKDLEKLLINGKLSDKAAFNYLFIHVILFTLVGYLPEGDNKLWFVWAHLIISLVAVIWGVKKTFEINRNGDNSDYFKRFISLSFVAAIRTLVVTLVFSFVLVVVHIVAEYLIIPPGQFAALIKVSELVIYALLNLYFFNLLITSFWRINAAGERAGGVEVA